MYIHIQNLSQVQEVPDPPATEVTNSAIALFAVVFPTQSPKVQEFALEQLTTLISAGALNRAPGRRAAIIINTALALLGATKVAVGEMSAESGDLKHPSNVGMYRTEGHGVACASVGIPVGHNEFYESVDFIGREGVSRTVTQSTQRFISKVA